MRIQANVAKVGWTKIDGQLVIYRPDDEKFFVCNSEFIWKILIEKDVTIQELVDYFLESYDCEREVAERDILEVLEMLKEENIVRYVK